MDIRQQFRIAFLALLSLLISGQLVWAGDTFTKKDSLALVKAISEFKKSEKKAYADLEKRIQQEADSAKAEEIASKGYYEIDKQLVDFITAHPQLMDFPEDQLDLLLDVGAISSTDRRIRYYAWTFNEYDDNIDYNDVSRVIQYRTDDGQVKTGWDTPFYEDSYAPWGYAFTPTEIVAFDGAGKRIYLVKEYIQDGEFIWNQIRAVTIENGNLVNVPIFDCNEICTKGYYASIYTDYFNPEGEFVQPEQVAYAIGCCSYDNPKTQLKDYMFEPALKYNPTMREIHLTLFHGEDLIENVYLKFDDKSKTFVLRTFPPTTDPTEIAVGQRVKAIMEDALGRFNQEEAACRIDSYDTEEEYNEKYTAALEKAREEVDRLDEDYCSRSWIALQDSVTTLATKNDDYYPDSGIWISGQELSDGPNMKLLSIDKIHKIDSNTYIVYYTFRRYLGNNIHETASVKMVKKRGNWYIDDFGATEKGGGWKEGFQTYLNEPW